MFVAGFDSRVEQVFYVIRECLFLACVHAGVHVTRMFVTRETATKPIFKSFCTESSVFSLRIDDRRQGIKEYYVSHFQCHLSFSNYIGGKGIGV